MNPSRHDVLIVGGGLVGSALAAALGDSDLDVAVLDRNAVPEAVGGEFESRASAITLASKTLYETVGAWPAMTAQRVTPIRAMQVWDEGGRGSVRFDAADMGEPALGYVVENRAMHHALAQRLAAFRNVHYRAPVAVASFQRGRDDIAVVLENGETLHARVLVAADGATSPTRRWAGIGTRGWDFDQTAIVANIRTERAHELVARQRFLATGPVALLPLDEPHTCSIVWSADTERARQLMALDDDGFMLELSAATEHAIGSVTRVSRRAAFPLSTANAEHYIDDRLVLTGDAAHRIHPLAGQGLNLGLADAATLAEVLLDAARRGKDLGSRAVLRRYERWRKGETLFMLYAMDAFKRGFGSTNPLIQGLRNFGLDFADGVAPVRDLIMRRAAGLDGDLPQSMRRHR